MRFLGFIILLVSMAFVPGTNVSAPDTDQNVMSTLWYQKSGEMRALYYQAYNLAELRIREYLAKPKSDRPAAVVLDIDETILDNSPSEALNILEGKPYSSARWQAWSDRASARALPGAVEFCRFLARNDISVFYVSNRMNTEVVSTLLNLQNRNLPYADRNHIFLKSETSSKEFRRSVIAKNFDILMFVGDNLADFDLIFEDRSQNFGFKTVDSLRNEFGKKFIILPNPMYGDWAKPLWGGKKDLTPTELADYRRSLLDTK
jgi:5'-nucleotidase (lipoprotein e(P4) family)